MKRSTRLFAALAALLAVLSMVLTACSPAATTPAAEPTLAPVVVNAVDGTEFRLEKPAERIISLAPSNTEVLFALGAGKQVIGREDFSNFPAEAAQIPSIGGSMGKYNMEEIVKLQPDLILASPLTASEVLQSLKEITPNVYVVSNPTDLEGMYANLVNVGTLTGHKAEAETLVEGLRARAKVVQDKVAGVTEKPKVFYELDATDPAKPWTAGQGTFIDLLIGLAGGQNIAGELPAYAQLSQEELIVQNPDIILLGDSLYGGITPESVAARPGWDAIAAVQSGRVLAFNDDLVSRPGPRMIDGLEELAKVIHPELFQ